MPVERVGQTGRRNRAKRTGPMPGRSTRYERSIETAERDSEMARYKHREQCTYQRVGERFGVTKKTAWESIQRALAATAAVGGAELRAGELLKLDAMEQAAWAVLRRNHIVVSNGKVMVDPRTSELLTDSGPVLQAIGVLLKVSERRAKLCGLDAPTQIRVSDQLTSEIEALAAELGVNDANLGAPHRMA